MNLESERNKPLFVVRGSQVSLCNAGGIINESLANFSAVRAEFANEYLVKASAARKLPNRILLNVDDSTTEELRDLVMKRLETSRDEKFEFLDGRIFSGREAAGEVRKGSEIGKFFFDLDVETLRIAQDAARKGLI